MTREQVKHLLPVMQAFADGKAVQFRHAGWSWYDVNGDPSFTSAVEWRIKSEPKTIWIAHCAMENIIFDSEESAKARVAESVTPSMWTIIKFQEVT